MGNKKTIPIHKKLSMSLGAFPFTADRATSQSWNVLNLTAATKANSIPHPKTMTRKLLSKINTVLPKICPRRRLAMSLAISLAAALKTGFSALKDKPSYARTASAKRTRASPNSCGGWAVLHHEAPFLPTDPFAQRWAVQSAAGSKKPSGARSSIRAACAAENKNAGFSGAVSMTQPPAKKAEPIIHMPATHQILFLANAPAPNPQASRAAPIGLRATLPMPLKARQRSAMANWLARAKPTTRLFPRWPNASNARNNAVFSDCWFELTRKRPKKRKRPNGALRPSRDFTLYFVGFRLFHNQGRKFGAQSSLAHSALRRTRALASSGAFNRPLTKSGRADEARPFWRYSPLRRFFARLCRSFGD